MMFRFQSHKFQKLIKICATTRSLTEDHGEFVLQGMLSVQNLAQ